MKSLGKKKRPIKNTSPATVGYFCGFPSFAKQLSVYFRALL